jgi:hypothetical protein
MEVTVKSKIRVLPFKNDYQKHEHIEFGSFNDTYSNDLTLDDEVE